jgi:hypothetical protein
VFALTYSVTGVPTLTRLYSIKPAMGSNTAGLSFDRAGNLYVISNTSERLGVWALPKAENQFVTLAPTNQVIKISISGVDKIQNPAELISVFPNPATDNVTVVADGTDMQMISLHDMNGRLIFTKNTNENRTDILVGNLQAGMYILKVKTSAGMAVKRIMKQ